MLDELKKLAKHTSIFAAGNVLSKLVGFLMIPFYTHYLTPANYGTLELLDLTASAIGLLLSGWIGVAMLRYYAESEDQEARDRVVTTALALGAFVGGLVLAGGVLWARPISELILKTPDGALYIRLISCSMFISHLHGAVWNFQRARQRSSFMVSLHIPVLVLMLSLNIYFIAIRKIGVVGILYSGLIAFTLETLILGTPMLRAIKPRVSLKYARIFATFGIPLIPAHLAFFILNFADRFFLQQYGNVSTVGIYALGYKFGFMVAILIVQPFTIVWEARMYEMAKQQSADHLFSRFFIYFSLVLTTAALGLSLVIREVITVIAAPAFHEAHRIVPLVALGYVFQGVAFYLQTGIYIEKKTPYLGVIGSASAAINLTLNYLLIPRYQVMGAAFATLLSFVAMAGLSYYVSEKLHPIAFRFSRLFLPVVLATGLYLAASAVPAPSLLLSAAVKCLFFLAFPVALYLLGFFEKEEVEKAREAAHLFLARYRWGAASSPER